MPNLNKVMLMGNVTRDPELKYLPKGTAFVDFSIAVNRQWKNDAGEKMEEVTFVDCESFGRTAEVIGEWCKKGKPIYVEGRLKLDTWDDKQTGQKRSRMKVIIEVMQLLGSKPESSGGQASSRPAQKPMRPPADPDLDAANDDGIPF